VKTILVTGVGAIIGYGVLRSLRTSEVRLLGADIYPDAVGQAWCDQFTVAPLTSDPSYRTWLQRLMSDHNVDLIIPGIEQDMDYFHDHREVVATWPTKVVLNTAPLVSLARDKWLMDEELRGLREPCRIESLDHGSFEYLGHQLGVPFLLKPRRGYASKGIVKVADEATFALHSAGLGDHLIAQRIVGSDDQEYTVSMFGDGTGAVLALSALQRKLAADGSTGKATSRPLSELPGLDQAVTRLAAHFKPEGPTNLQFRRVHDDWKLLEINPRISSSTSIRSAFGYNEAAMCIDYYLNGVRPTQPIIHFGHAARYIEDVVVVDRNTL
jgi:carbamoyl-phosphate synthase large subunit